MDPVATISMWVSGDDSRTWEYAAAYNSAVASGNGPIVICIGGVEVVVRRLFDCYAAISLLDNGAYAQIDREFIRAAGYTV